MPIRYNQAGSLHVLLLGLLLVVAAIGFAGWRVWDRAQENKTNKSIAATTADTTESAATIPTSKRAMPDSADTLLSPTKETSADGKTYFIYGAPAGQNNKTPKRVIVSLPGHGTTADDGYNAWNNHIAGGQYALAEFNWWRGTGEKKEDYYLPTEVMVQVEAFLSEQGYTDSDIVILQGFSRGSANTYAVVVQDRLKKPYVIDAVISNAGKYQSDFPLTNKQMSDAEITRMFTGIPWVLACGGKDPNPMRDGCPGMQETQSFLSAHGANTLGIVSDPNGGHGAFHMSDLKLPQQALNLIEAAL